jgi:hypothetical protein
MNGKQGKDKLGIVEEQIIHEEPDEAEIKTGIKNDKIYRSV